MAVCTCKHCGGSKLTRVSREGFLDNKVYLRFGYYPWKCKDCGSRVRLQERGERIERRRASSQKLASRAA